MVPSIQNKYDLKSTNGREAEGRETETSELDTPPADPQVKARRAYSPRRSFDGSYKCRMIAAYDACKSVSERGALLRREGLYHSRIAFWKRELAKGKLSANKKQPGVAPRTDHLAKEIEQLKKKLAQAQAIIDLQKKVSELLGMHILPHEGSEGNS
jgi:transposase